MKIVDINELNEKYKTRADFTEADAEYFQKIDEIKEAVIKNAATAPVILIAGPSGSGKTTTAHNLEAALDKAGAETHTISLDNYFRTVTEEERSTIDFESPSRVDGELLSDHIAKIARGEEIEIPVFDFPNMRRSDETIKLKRSDGELIIFEGIHALNPSVITAPGEFTAKIYVSVRTRVSYGNEVLQPEYVRLLRRIARDKLYRGRTAAVTLSYLESVTRGENNFVKPFKRFADFQIDTFLGYEAGVYKSIIERDIINVAADEKDENAKKILTGFLSCVCALDKEKTPENSLIREFIGR